MLYRCWAFIKAKAKIVFLGSFILIMCLLVALFVVKGHSQKLNAVKVEALINQNDCSDSALKSVSGERPSHSQVSDSIKLLDYLSSCYVQRQEYKQALSELNLLKQYYGLSNQKDMVTDTQTQIEATKLNLNYKPIKEVPTPNNQDSTFKTSPLSVAQQK